MKPRGTIVRSMLVPLAAFFVLMAACGEPATAPSVEPGADDQVLSSRLAGPDRIGTSIEIARAAFPDGADAVYLTGADRMADAVAGGSLTRGPTLLVPSCGPIPGEVVIEIQRLSPTEVVALGGAVAVCDATLEEARIVAEPDVRYRVEVDAAIGGSGGDGLSVTVEQPQPLSLRQMSRHLVTFESTTERTLENCRTTRQRRPPTTRRAAGSA